MTSTRSQRVEVRDRHAEPRNPISHPVATEIRLPQSEIDVVGAERARESRRQRHLLEGRVRRHERAQRGAAMALDDRGKMVRHEIESRRPVDGHPFAAFLDHRSGEPLVARQRLVREAVLVRKPAFVHCGILERHDAHHAIAFHLHDEIAAERIVRRHRTAPRELPGPRRVAERLRGQRADRADVDHVAGQLGVDRVADERDDLRVLAATDHAELHDAGDFLAEADAARALDATRHLLGRDERPQVLVEDDALRFGVPRRRSAIADREVLQLAFAALVADRAVERMVDQQELHHAVLRLLRLLRMRPDLHALGRRGRAGGQRLRRLLDLHQAHPAIGGDRQLLVPAEMRHVDVELVRGVHHRAARCHLHLSPVDLEVQHDGIPRDRRAAPACPWGDERVCKRRSYGQT